MQNSRTFGILFLLAVLGAAAVWFLGFQEQSDPAPVMATGAERANEKEGTAAPVSGGLGTSAVDADPTRVAAPALTATAGNGAAATGRGLTGQVVDDKGAPVAGAAVRCWAGWGGGADFGGEDFDWADFDQAAMQERFRAMQKDRTETTTDAEGRFRLVAVGTGRNVQIDVRARQFTVLQKTVSRPTEADADIGQLTVQRGAVVSGRVVDRAGKPVQGARVARVDKGQGNNPFDFAYEMPGAEEMQDFGGDEQSLTDAGGRFELAHVAPGEFALRARHRDHPPARLDDLTAPVGAALEDLVVVAEPGATISGRVLGVPEGQKPLRIMASLRRDDSARPGSGGGAEVLMDAFGGAGEMLGEAGLGFGEKQVDTGADFAFELRGLQVGKTYRIWATQNGRGLAGNALCTQRLDTAAGTAGLELRFDAGITVTFQVQDSKSGAPIERLWVKDQLRGGGGMEDMMAFMPRSGRSKAYPGGSVTIANLRPKKKQSLTLAIDAIGYTSFERKDIALPTTGAHDLGVIQLDPAPIVRVLVTAGADRRPVAGATVKLTEASPSTKRGGNPMEMMAGMAPGMGGGASGPRSGKTDAQGACDLNAFGSPMLVTVTTKDYAPYRSEAVANTGGLIQHEVALVRGGSVVVTVLDSERALVAAARVEHTTPSGERDNRDTDKQGLATFERLTPGEHRFRLGKAGGRGNIEFVQQRMREAQGQTAPTETDWLVVTVADGAREALQLTKAATATLRGIVRENGVPLVGARIAFVEGAEERSSEGGVEQRITELMGDMGGPGGGGGRGRNGRTGDDGSYQIAELPEGQHRLRITTRERVMPAVVPVLLRTGENVFDVELDATVLRGIVKDSTGAPVAGATVSIVPVQAKGATGAGDERTRAIEEAMGGIDIAQFGGGGRTQQKSAADGSYELRGVQAGKPMQVKATAKGFAAAMSEVVEVAVGGTRDGVDITLGAAGKVKVEVADAPPFGQVRAVKVDADGTAEAGVPAVTQIMRNGKCTLDGLRPGRWKVELRGLEGNPREPRFVEVVAGETVTANL